MSVQLENIKGAIFDLDGVVTQTASLHAQAWKQLFDEYNSTRKSSGRTTFRPFDIHGDYLEYVDGRPRYEGVASFLRSRDIELAWGSSDDSPKAETVCGLGNRKDFIFQELLAREKPQVFPDAVEQIRSWKESGIKTAVVSSSRNCQKVLKAAQIEDLFLTRVDGNDLQKLDIKGKPAPDMFLEAARRLQVDPEESFIVEDAEAGVEAGRQGGFRYVVGMDLGGRKESLCQHGANRVVRSLKEIELIGSPMTGKWNVPTYFFEDKEGLKAEMQGRRPALFLDYDGTLTEIVSRPQDARISSEMQKLIKLAAKSSTVAVISGRDREDVKNMVGLEEIIYAGSHGFDVTGPKGLNFQVEGAQEALPQLDEADEELKNLTQEMSGVWVERKKYAIAVHFREAESEEDVSRLSAAVDSITERRKTLRRTEGKKIIELRPNINWHKGRALSWIKAALDIKEASVIPIYIGDDVTDEDAFAEIRDVGFGILVSSQPRPSAAKYWVRDIAEVEQVLRFLLHESRQTKREMETSDWKLVYNAWRPDRQSLREAICTLGNGYFATRGAFSEVKADGVHYPGTYLAGGYDRAETDIAGRVIENEDLVNWPNWLSIKMKLAGDEHWFDIEQVELERFCQELNVKEGLLQRSLEFEHTQGRRSRLVERRFIHMGQPHVAGVEWTLTPLNWSGQVILRSGIDGDIENSGVERYQALTRRHIDVIEKGLVGEKGIFLVARSRQSEIKMAQAARLEAFLDGIPVSADRRTIQEKNQIWQEIEASVEQHKDLRLEKMISLYTSRDVAISEPAVEAKKDIHTLGGFLGLLASHKQAWQNLWNRCDIEISESTYTQFVLRLHIFHLLQTTSVNTIDLDVGVPARGWHGEAYRGHIFWDELFIFPFLNLRMPELTRSLLMYRYRRLNEAQRLAQMNGYKGAMFPWQSGSDGRDESQVLHLNPKSGRWVPDHTHLQRHIGAAVAYNVWQYYESTSDIEFMSFYGAKIILEVTRFFASLTSYNSDRHRYDIVGVVGPDEFHTHYPGSDEPGINNNAYTNVMAAWLFEHALRTLSLLTEDRQGELCAELSISSEEIHHWKHLSQKMFIPFLADGIVAQFEGYENLKEFPWEKYQEQYGDIQRLDRILGSEEDSPNNYRASKQADVIMLFYLFSAEELEEIFTRLGYEFKSEWIPQNIEFYSQRVSHGSTLSRVVHAWVLARVDRPRSWHLFKEALTSDISDIQGGTTSEGIHLGAMAGTVDIMQRCYPGLEVRNEVLWFNPSLPEEMPGMNFRVRFQGHWLRVKITHERLTVQFEKSWVGPVSIGYKDEIHEMHQGEFREFALQP